jgi:DNA modification methylase
LAKKPKRERGPKPLVPIDPFLSLEDAAAALGFTPRRLRSLAFHKKVAFRGSIRDPFFRAADLDDVVRAAFADRDLEPARTPDVARPLTTGRAVVARERHLALNTLIVGDALNELSRMPSASVQAVVTSPPFWGQRLYADETDVSWQSGAAVAFGREETPEQYAEHSAEILGALIRVLKARGTIWWNIGDSYLTRTILHGTSSDRIRRYGGTRSSWAGTPDKRYSSGHSYLKDKDLALIPAMVAMAAQRQGLWLRSVVVWNKQHPATKQSPDGVRAHMPEIVTDRPVTGHEYILLFAKEEAYDYYPTNITDANGDATTLNLRTVWSFPPVSKGGVHGARFPDELPRRCIQLATQPGDVVLDPFAGQGTTLGVAAALGRAFVGIEISPTYAAEARRRLAKLHLRPAAATGVSRRKAL